METTIKMEIALKFPYKLSLISLEELSSLWGLQIISAGTKKRIAKISIKKATFKQMFKTEPKKGKMLVPDVLSGFIANIQIND